MIQVKVITPFNNYDAVTNSVNGVSIQESDYVLCLDSGIKQFSTNSFVDVADTEAKIELETRDVLIYTKLEDGWVCTSGASTSASSALSTPLPTLPN